MVLDTFVVVDIHRMGMVVAFVDRQALNIVNSTVPPFRVHFVNRQRHQRVKSQQSNLNQHQPMQECMTNRMRFLCCYVKSTKNQK